MKKKSNKKITRQLAMEYVISDSIYGSHDGRNWIRLFSQECNSKGEFETFVSLLYPEQFLYSKEVKIINAVNPKLAIKKPKKRRKNANK